MISLIRFAHTAVIALNEYIFTIKIWFWASESVKYLSGAIALALVHCASAGEGSLSHGAARSARP